MAIFNSKLLVYQRVNPIKTTILLVKPQFFTTIKPPLNHQRVLRTVKVDQFNRIVSNLIGTPLDQEVK